MSTYGMEAIELEEAFENRPERIPENRPSFEVVTGGGLDARVRAGVSSEFLARAKAVVAAAVLVFLLGSVRIALTSLTVSQLSENMTLRSQIESYETSNDNLRVERSLMSSATRIDRIATQNYGMVSPDTYDVIVIPSPVDEEAAEELPEGEEAEEATESDGVSLDAPQLAAGL